MLYNKFGKQYITLKEVFPKIVFKLYVLYKITVSLIRWVFKYFTYLLMRKRTHMGFLGFYMLMWFLWWLSKCLKMTKGYDL